jgi:hypothetical protein
MWEGESGGGAAQRTRRGAVPQEAPMGETRTRREVLLIFSICVR